MEGVHGGLVVFKIARSSFVDRLLRFTGKRWFELGGVVCVDSWPQGAVLVVTVETEGVGRGLWLRATGSWSSSSSSSSSCC